MSDSDKAFSGSIPELYDTYLVPLIFDEYADDLAERAASLSPQSVLETAAGSGVVTRALANRLEKSVRYTVTDLNQPMLDHAAIRQGTDDRITWQQADALALPFDDAAFDTVVCQFGAMFFPDRVAGYREAHRVLKPEGRFLFNVWDHLGANVFANMVNDAAAAHFPDNPPPFLPRTPYGYYDVATIETDLNSAGFATVSVSTITKLSRAPSAELAARAFSEGTPLRTQIEERDASKLDTVTKSAAEEISKRFGSGEVAAEMQAHVIEAIA